MFTGQAINNSDLNRASSDLNVVTSTLQNIGEIGRVPDFRNAMPRSPLQMQFPLYDWLRQTEFSRIMNTNPQIIRDPDTRELVLVLPYSYGTALPEDTTGKCCWVPFDLMKCGGKIPLRLLCLKDCEPILDQLVHARQGFGANDFAPSPFVEAGDTVASARRRMARYSMAFFTIRNVILGTTTTSTDVLKPFAGLLQVMENPAVIKIVGTNPLAAFDALSCRLSVLGTNSGEIVFALHPLVYQGIAKLIVRGKTNEYPNGWDVDVAGNIRFMTHRFIQDKLVPLDMESGTGDVWMLNSSAVGVHMGTTPQPEDSFIRTLFASTDTPADGCANECEFYYNYGAVASNNYNYLAVITRVPIGANCLGDSLFGLDALINPQTPIPYIN